MIQTLVSLKNLIKTKSYHIDYPLFRLHYRVTVSALLAFCLILTAKILFGDTIDCKGRISGESDFFDNLCYSQGTFTVYAVDLKDLKFPDKPTTSPLTSSSNATTEPESNNGGFLQGQMMNYGSNIFPLEALAGTDLGEYLKYNFRQIHRLTKNHNLNFSKDIQYTHTGIMVPREDEEEYSTVFWHRYYQYMPIILFLQAIFFYFPHFLWKNWENGIISSICKQLHDNRLSPTEFMDSNYYLIDYLQSCFTLNKSLVYKYYLCHILLLLNLFAQIIVLNVIFNNQFVTYGMDVFYYLFIDKDIYGLRGVEQSNNDHLNSPMDFVFPKITRCTVEFLSQAGLRPEKRQLLCVLPLNILHDKFFLILWFWFLVLAVATTFQIVYDTMYTSMPILRRYLFKRRFGPYLSSENRLSSSLSELFMLDLIGSNSDKFAFSALLKKLNKEEWPSSGASENQSLV